MALAAQYGRYGYRRITALLQSSGWPVGKDRVQRIWRREGLKVPQQQRPRRRLWLNGGSCVRLRPEHRNHVWSYDLVSARTHDGRTLRLLTLLDEVELPRFCGQFRSVVPSPAMGDSRWTYSLTQERWIGYARRVCLSLRLFAPASTGAPASRTMSVAHCTRRCLRRVAFVVVGAEVTQGGVPAAWVVPAFDELEDRHARLGLGTERTPVDELALQRGEKALGHGVVKAVPGRPGRGKHPHLPAPFAKGERSVLRALDALIFVKY